MLLVFQLALRNIWRQRRRNKLVLILIVVSITGVFVMNTLSRGMERDFLANSVENLRGHLKILAPNHLDEPGLKHRISTDGDLTPLENNPQIEAWTVRLRTPAVIMSERETRGVEIVGIDPNSETHSFVKDLVITGQPLTKSSDQHLVIGARLAEKLRTDIGRRLVVIMTGPDDATIEIGFRVLGIFEAKTAVHEDFYVVTGLSALQAITGTSDVTEISVHLTDPTQLNLVQSSLAEHFTEQSVVSWLELDPFIGEMYALMKFTIFILIGVIQCTLVFGLINALVTAVLERAREFGMLRAVGMKNRLVVLQVVIECVVIMLVGLVIGIACGLLIYAWLADGIDLAAFAEGVEAFGMGARMVPHLVAGDFVIIAVASVLLGLIASYFPAKRILKAPLLQMLQDA